MFASSEGNLNICLAYKWIYALRMTYDICKNAILFACKGMQSLGATSNINSIYRGKYILGTQRHKGGAIVSISCQLLAGIVAEMDAQPWSCTSLFKFSDLKKFNQVWIPSYLARCETGTNVSYTQHDLPFHELLYLLRQEFDSNGRWAAYSQFRMNVLDSQHIFLAWKHYNNKLLYTVSAKVKLSVNML